MRKDFREPMSSPVPHTVTLSDFLPRVIKTTKRPINKDVYCYPEEIKIGGKKYKFKQRLKRRNGGKEPAVYWGMHKEGESERPVVLDDGKFALLSKEEFLKLFE